MLDFFRKYQKYIFLIVTIVIVISFSFFGTYSTLDSNPNVWREQVAFQAVNGHDVTQLDVEDLAHFLATDSEDKVLFGGVWGPNFLNDGVIRKDFIETGLATELAIAYKNDLKDDYDSRLLKEKKFQLYKHPQAPFLSVETIWSHFSPGIVDSYYSLRSAQDALDKDAFNHRIALFLTQKTLPASTLKYILRFQENQSNSIQADPKLDQTDLSLFGYHTIEDWFGPKFIRLVSEFIINASILAEEQGYEVSRAEVQADLLRNTRASYQENINNPSLGVASPQEYFNEQLRRLNMDASRVMKIWRQILLFRRYFQDAGSTALIDALPSQKLNQFGYENVKVDLYRLPQEFRLSNFEDLQNFEIYLQIVAKQNKANLLELPKEFLSVAEILKTYPQLVQKRYELEVSEASQKSLLARIGLKELWNWEVQEENWKLLQSEFPILALKEGLTREDRFEVLENLDYTTRNKVDSFAKTIIIQQHPDWIAAALDQAQPKKMTVGIRTEGGKIFVSGLDTKEKREKFINLLDKASLGVKPELGSPLYAYTDDNKSYYRITVLQKADKQEILTFAEAQSDGTLNQIKDAILEKYYLKVRDNSPEVFQTSKGDWQPFSNVKQTVANQYFEKNLLALESIQMSLHPNPKEVKVWNRDEAANLRFYNYLKKIKEDIQNNQENEEKWIKPASDQATFADHSSSLLNQWKLEKTSPTVDRQTKDHPVKIDEASAIAVESWSSIKNSRTGDLAFYKMIELGGNNEDMTLVAEQVEKIQKILGSEAKRNLMEEVLVKLKKEKAISLAYLKKNSGEGDSSTESQNGEITP